MPLVPIMSGQDPEDSSAKTMRAEPTQPYMAQANLMQSKMEKVLLDELDEQD